MAWMVTVAHNLFSFQHARVAKLADAKDLKSFGAMHRAGSSPAPGTNLFNDVEELINPL